MASMFRGPGGHVIITFCQRFTGKRPKLHFGKMRPREAELFKQRLDIVITCQAKNLPLPAESIEWLDGLDQETYGKLVKAKLVKPRELPGDVGIAAFIDAYIAGRTNAKPSTLVAMQIARNRIVDHFKPDRAIGSITAADADGFLVAMQAKAKRRRSQREKSYAPATIGRTIGRARQFFRHAVRAKLIAENPFADVKKPATTNRDRLHFVTREVAEKVSAACPDPDWRLLFALCRFGGLRCPSEVLRVTWADVDWKRGRILVHSPKTEHNEGGAERWIPLFPELLPLLEEAFFSATNGTNRMPREEAEQTRVVTGRKSANCNLRTQFTRILHRAGLSPWPRLFQNLRATRETELAKDYPTHVVCSWIGNSERIAAKHYLSVTDDHFEQAARAPEGAKPGAHREQQQAQAATGGHRQIERNPLPEEEYLPNPADGRRKLPRMQLAANGPGGTRTRTPCGTGS